VNDTITQLGVGGIFAILVIQQVLTFMGKRKNGAAPARFTIFDSPEDRKRVVGTMVKCAEQVNKLYDQHQVKDSDGVPVWYVRRSLEDAVKSLSTNVNKQSDLLRELVTEVKTMSKERHEADQRRQ